MGGGVQSDAPYLDVCMIWRWKGECLVVVTAVDVGGRGSCARESIGQRKQAARVHRHTSHTEHAASCHQRHSLHVLGKRRPVEVYRKASSV